MGCILIVIAAYELAELYKVATVNRLSNIFLSLIFKNFLYCFHIFSSNTVAILKDGIVRLIISHAKILDITGRIDEREGERY